MGKIGTLGSFALLPIFGLMLYFIVQDRGLMAGPSADEVLQHVSVSTEGVPLGLQGNRNASVVSAGDEQPHDETPTLIDNYERSCKESRTGYTICPRLFVLGAQKGGTTTFYGYMEGHRDFRPAMPLDGGEKRVKELSYFIHKHDPNPTGAREEIVENYLPFFSKRRSPGEWTSDATPTMMYYAEAPQLLVNSGLRENARFVILLRDPVDRAISNMEKRVRGKESRPAPESYNLKDVADKCIPLLKKCRSEARGPGTDGLGYFHCYDTLSWDNLWMDLCETLNKGFYVDTLKNWLMAGFKGREEFCILSTSRFLASPAHTAHETGLNKRCLEDIGVDLSGFPDWKQLPADGHYNVHNTTMTDEELEVRERLAEFYAPANAELKRVLAEDFGVDDFKFEWP